MIISSPTGCPGSPTSFFESYMTIKEVFMREVTPSEYKGPSSYRRMVYDGRKRVGVRVIISGDFGMVTPVASFKLLNACAARKKSKRQNQKIIHKVSNCGLFIELDSGTSCRCPCPCALEFLLRMI